jgi:TolB-like protein/Tfp pilus assembly protein PilF
MTNDPPTQATPGSDVFISYASQDAAVANAIVHTLEHAGLRCWIAPRDVTPGGHYADAIMGAISGAKALVLVLSDSALASKHVGKEIERASSKGRAIIALRTTATPLPPAFEYFLSESQWIDIGPGGIAGISAKLVEAVRSHLTPGTSSAPAKPLPVDRKPAPSQRLRIVIASAAVLALVLAYFVAPKVWLAKHAPAEQPTTTAVTTAAAISDKSIAVLPFTDMSEKHDQEYMSDGLAEELLNLLAQAPGLKVIARTSSFAFKGKAVDIAEIAKRLNVAHVLEGSVRKSGNKIRITAQLIRTADSTHLWSETYDRPLKDIFAVQDEIAGAIAQALQIQLAGGELSRRKGGTQNLDAYQLYLRAVSTRNQGSKSSLATADEYLEQAIELDPSFGLAWQEHAFVVGMQTDAGVLAAMDGYERARQLARHALQISPDLADAQATLSYVSHARDWDWVAAGTEARRALAMDPTNGNAQMAAGFLSITLGHFADAERQLQSVLVRDPLNTNTIWNLGEAYYLSGRFDDAERTFRRLLELAPNYQWTRRALAQTLLARSKPEAALAMAQQMESEDDRLCLLPIALQATGRVTEADAALALLVKNWSGTSAYWIAAVYAYRGDHDLALRWLDIAYEQRGVDITYIVGEPLFSKLAGDPRFKAFLRKMNLPE